MKMGCSSQAMIFWVTDENGISTIGPGEWTQPRSLTNDTYNRYARGETRKVKTNVLRSFLSSRLY